MAASEKLRVLIVEDSVPILPIKALSEVVDLQHVDLTTRVCLSSGWPSEIESLRYDFMILDMQLAVDAKVAESCLNVHPQTFAFCMDNHEQYRRTLAETALPERLSGVSTVNDGGLWIWAEVLCHRRSRNVTACPTLVYSANTDFGELGEALEYAGLLSISDKGFLPRKEDRYPLDIDFDNMRETLKQMKEEGRSLTVFIDGRKIPQEKDKTIRTLAEEQATKVWGKETARFARANVDDKGMIRVSPPRHELKNTQLIRRGLEAASRLHLNKIDPHKLEGVADALERNGGEVGKTDLGGGWTFQTLLPHLTKALDDGESRAEIVKHLRGLRSSMKLGRQLAEELQCGGLKALTHARTYKSCDGLSLNRDNGHSACYSDASKQLERLLLLAPECPYLVCGAGLVGEESDFKAIEDWRKKSQVSLSIRNVDQAGLLDTEDRKISIDNRGKGRWEVSPAGDVQYFAVTATEFVTEVKRAQAEIAQRAVNEICHAAGIQWCEDHLYRAAVILFAKYADRRNLYRSAAEAREANTPTAKDLLSSCEILVAQKQNSTTEFVVDVARPEEVDLPEKVTKFLNQRNYHVAHVFLLWGAKDTRCT